MRNSLSLSLESLERQIVPVVPTGRQPNGEPSADFLSLGLWHFDIEGMNEKRPTIRLFLDDLRHRDTGRVPGLCLDPDQDRRR